MTILDLIISKIIIILVVAMKKITLLLFTLFISQPSFSADQTIDMLNKLGKEHMVYSQKVVNIEVGDTVFWKSTTPGHNVEFIKG